MTDLPGIYSMSPYSSEEIVTRNFVLDEHPKGIINIVDATNIEKSLSDHAADGTGYPDGPGTEYDG